MLVSSVSWVEAREIGGRLTVDDGEPGGATELPGEVEEYPGGVTEEGLFVARQPTEATSIAAKCAYLRNGDVLNMLVPSEHTHET